MAPRLLSYCFAVLLLASTGACQINACKYLLVTDFSSDPYGIARELRTQGRVRGFVVISIPSEVSADDTFKTCVMSGSWSAEGYGGSVSIRVVDAMSNEVMGEAATGGTNWWGISRTVRSAVGKIYSQLSYTGFNEDL